LTRFYVGVGRRVGPFYVGVSQRVGGTRRAWRRTPARQPIARQRATPQARRRQPVAMSRARRFGWRVAAVLWAVLAALVVVIIIAVATGNWS